jgi:hypothetical protein
MIGKIRRKVRAAIGIGKFAIPTEIDASQQSFSACAIAKGGAADCKRLKLHNSILLAVSVAGPVW